MDDLADVRHGGRVRRALADDLGFDSQIIGESATYTPTAADVGKALHCAVNANNGGATVWKTAVALEILAATNAGTTPGGAVPATLSLTLGTPASFGAFTPGVAKTTRRRRRPTWSGPRVTRC